MKNMWILLLITSAVFACTTAANTDETRSAEISDDSLMTLIQYRTFQYFWDGAEPTSGAARERFHADNVYPENDKHIITSGGTGFGVMAILVGIERKFITRQQ
ncbi:MAG TPA: beta-glucosidase, partial [Chryseosolibacter sp.]